MSEARLIVVGAGLSGLFASHLAQRQGSQLTNISQGRGAWDLFHGCIDIWKQATPTRALNKLRSSHPYALAGMDALRAGIDAFTLLMERTGYPYHGELSQHILLPQAGGTVRKTSFVPEGLIHGDLRSGEPFVAASIPGLDDFSAEYLLTASYDTGIPCEGIVELPIPESMKRTYPTSLSLAQMFDQIETLPVILEEWADRVHGLPRLAFPAALGFERHPEVLRVFQEVLKVSIFEIPAMPPSVPGLRIERILRNDLLRNRINLLEGKRAIGLIDGRSGGRLVAGIQIERGGNPTTVDADAVILATGGFLNGGLVSSHDGRVQESVFDLPLSADPARDHWTRESFLSTQPYAGFGVLVDESMRPRGADGSAIFENLFACGGIIAGSDREIEGSRQGIDLATAYRAVQAAVQWVQDQ
jgi:glycerol-3-phosphate dehydrogenase subunit B